MVHCSGSTQVPNSFRPIAAPPFQVRSIADGTHCFPTLLLLAAQNLLDFGLSDSGTLQIISVNLLHQVKFLQLAASVSTQTISALSTPSGPSL